MWLRRFNGCAVSMADAVSVASPFLCLRRFYACGVSVAAPFLWLRRFCGFAVSMASPFLCLRRFNGFGVSMASTFLAALFEWLKPFLCFAFLAMLFLWLKPFNFVEGCAVQWLRRFSLRCSNGWRRLTSLRASPFSLRCLTSLRASPFNGFVVSMPLAFQWLTPFECLTSLRATPFTFEWLAVAELVEVRRFYVSVLFAGGSLVFQHIERMLNHWKCIVTHAVGFVCFLGYVVACILSVVKV